jgi:hypothetical protein
VNHVRDVPASRSSKIIRTPNKQMPIWQPNDAAEALLEESPTRARHRNIQDRKLMAGLSLFVCGDLLNGLGYFTAKGKGAAAIAAWTWLADGILQTTGLLVFTTADADVDRFVQRRPFFAAGFAAIYLASQVGLQAFPPPILLSNLMTLAEAPPFLYMLCRFRPIVIETQPEFPRFSTLLGMTLALDLLGNVGGEMLVSSFGVGGVDDDAASDGIARLWPLALYGCFAVSGAMLMVLVYTLRIQGQYSRTIGLNHMMYVYLFFLGSGDLLYRCLKLFIFETMEPLPTWFFGPVHIIPTAVMLMQRQQLLRWLARDWIQNRAKHKYRGDSPYISPQDGTMQEVEAALAAGLDLDAYRPSNHPLPDSQVADCTLLIMAAYNGFDDAVNCLVNNEVEVNKVSLSHGWTPVLAAAFQGNARTVALLIQQGADINATAEDGSTALLVATAHGHTETIKLLAEAGASTEMQWMGLTAMDAATALQRESAIMTLRAYESSFQGFISVERGSDCVVSWPGIYAREWDILVAQAKKGGVSAAVVFLPDGTANFGKHGSDGCYCKEVSLALQRSPIFQFVYDSVARAWFRRRCMARSSHGVVLGSRSGTCAFVVEHFDYELGHNTCRITRTIRRRHIETAVEREQHLQVFFFDGHRGCGKVSSWNSVATEAQKRDSFQPKRQAFLQSLPEAEHLRLHNLSRDAGSSRALLRTERSERDDEEEMLFRSSLSGSERKFLERQEGLGNSQKAEVAWLERRYKETGNVGYLYEELDVGDFA